MHFTSNFVRVVNIISVCCSRYRGLYSVRCTYPQQQFPYLSPYPQRVRRTDLPSIANCTSFRFDPVETTPVVQCMVVDEQHLCLLKSLLRTIYCTMYVSPATTPRYVSLPQRVRRADLPSIAILFALTRQKLQRSPQSEFEIKYKNMYTCTY